MADYISLQSLYYKEDPLVRDAFLEKESQKRKSESSTFDIGINTKSGRLFLAVPRQLSLLNETLLRVERKVSQLWHELPGIAQWAYLRGLIMNEIMSTNEIEGVYSTRRQIEKALVSAESKSTKEYRRFKEFANLYLELTNNNHIYPKTPTDIRMIYDAVVAGELSENQQPDGILFRKDPVDIVAPTQKIIHRGVLPESEITRMLEQMIALVDSGVIPPTFAAISAHFVFEYIHPFYDGNGRTGRYLLALYLSEPLSLATVLSLSSVIAENKGSYYKAFAAAEKKLNKGELTFFVIQMMEFIRMAQDSVIEELEYKKYLLQKAQVALDNFDARPYSLSQKEKKVAFQALQHYLFDTFSEISLSDISHYTEVGSQTARKYTISLEEKGLLRTVSQKPLKFELTEKALNVFTIEANLSPE